jgi:diacylglycerol O-acyltransferase/trehalose O-mycolyltransferase
MKLSYRRLSAQRSRIRVTATAVALLIVCAACATGPASGTTSGRRHPSATVAAAEAAGSGEARIVATTRVSDRMVDLTVDSPALGQQAKVRLLLPRRYAATSKVRWPVLYLLHGCCDTYVSWTRSTDVEELSAKSDVLVAMPQGGLVGFYSDWLDGPDWETFHTKELPALLKREYRAGNRQAIAGNSMGGLGALVYTARHPGTFSAAASFSGIVHTRLSAQTSRGYLGLIQSQGEDPLALWGDPLENARVWAAHNPYDLAKKLHRIPLFISAGNGQPGPYEAPGAQADALEEALYAENIALRDKLTRLGADATFNFYGPGVHNWPYWERELHHAWPMLTAGLARP